MQEILLPDYLDGSIPTKNEYLKIFKSICNYVQYIKPISPTTMSFDFKNCINEEISPTSMLEILNYDASMKVFLRAYYEYRTRPNKNYVFTKEIVDALKDTKIDIKGSYLPKDFTAFLSIPNLKDHDGDDIKGVFVRIDKDVITLGMLLLNDFNNKSYSVSHFHIYVPNDEQTIEDVICKLSYTEVGVNLKNKSISEITEMLDSGEELEVSKIPAQYHHHIHIILNCILYVTHTEGLKEEINSFSTKRSKKDWELKRYTQKPYLLIGRNFQVPRVYSDDEIKVRGHWRWQPHGPAWSLLKHIYIDPYLKNKKE